MNTVGFTGTRRGLSTTQRESLTAVLHALGGRRFVHGDCIGADAEAAEIAARLGYDVECRPCDLRGHRAFSPVSRQVAEPLPPLERNREIVRDGDVLVACPGEFREVLRSGTWATVRFARRERKALWLVLPDGRVLVEDARVALIAAKRCQ